MSVGTLRENTLYLKPFKHHAQGKTNYCHRQFVFQKYQLKCSPGSTTDIQHRTLPQTAHNPTGSSRALHFFLYVICSFCYLYSQ